MTEITRVPLQPIAKGSLIKLWLGVLVVALIGAGIAYLAVPKGVSLEVVQAGTGPNPGPEDVIFAKYTGKLPDGTVFDETRDIPLPVQGIFPEGSPLPLGEMMPSFSEGAQKMQKGGKYVLTIPGDKAYGDTPPPGSDIPPNSPLIFDVELIEIMSMSDFESRIQAIQQMMQQQQGAGGAPGGAPSGPPPGQ